VIGARSCNTPRGQFCDDVDVISADFGFCFLLARLLGGVVDRSGGGSETVSCYAFWAAIAASWRCLAAA
jgi:hypothetical protein